MPAAIAGSCPLQLAPSAVAVRVRAIVPVWLASPRTCHTRLAPEIAATGHELAAVNRSPKLTLRPSRVGATRLVMPARPWASNAARIAHSCGVPLSRLPSSSSVASAARYDDGMSLARCRMP